ncbi:LIM/homeobox protein Lhx9 [Echinococcus granulosus]|nr:LIM/homeobox protein Lhx9 [Echinococcus granulosus]
MTHCAKCKVRMPQGSLVQRIFDCVFHLDCFTCARCNWRLQFGEYVAFAKGEVFCAWHLRPLPPPASVQPQSELPETSWSDPGRTNVDSIENPLIEEFFDGDDKSSQSKPNSMGRTSSGSELAFEEVTVFDENGKIPATTLRSFTHQSHGHQGHALQQQQRPSSRSTSASSGPQQRSKRVRTSFTPQQIAVLQASFKTVSNPDGQELERIAQATSLTKRVTQVWFQNARARKKKNVQNSMQHQQPSPRAQSVGVQGEVTEAFIPNPPLTGTGDQMAGNDSEVLVSSPPSPQLTSTLEEATLGPYFSKGPCL